MARKTRFDYIIVGAGSAGCALANRLTEDGNAAVLLVEAGPGDRDWRIQMPSALAYPLQGTTYNWAFETEPEPYLDGRIIGHPRGKVLGGSSSVNGMLYVRGHARDYDRWAQCGARGWSYAEVLPYFRKLETHFAPADEFHGDSGPVHITQGEATNPLSQAFIEAGKQAGYPVTDDINGAQQEGFGRIPRTTYKGRRWNTANAYLRPAMTRPNLTVVTQTMTRRLLFQGTRVTGIQTTQGGVATDYHADREVILSGGAFGSPQLLMVSGIGPEAVLADHGIAPVVVLAGVGQNMQDHADVVIQHYCTAPVSLYRKLKPLSQVGIGLRWFLFKDGLGATNHYDAGAFIRSGPHVEHPDLHFEFVPLAIDAETLQSIQSIPSEGFQSHCDLMRPTSVGRLTIRSADMTAPPVLRFNYLQTQNDRDLLRTAVKILREVHLQKAFDPYRGPEYSPGPDVRTDAEIDAFIRAKMNTGYHPVGTCKMGAPDDTMAVVDPECRVRGVEGLRVVDASVMPSIVSGNTNAPTIMIAEKVADQMRGRALAAA
jgi:choline dehydrogenase